MISFTLIPRQLTDGRIAIVLHLYRNKKLASTTTVAAVERTQATMVLVKCRVHLRNLGVQDANGQVLKATG